MKLRAPLWLFIAVIVMLGIFPAGCSMLSKPAPKISAGEVPENKQSFKKNSLAPTVFYDLDQSATLLFNALTEKNWQSAAQSLALLQNSWQKIAAEADEKETTDAEAILEKLTDAVTAQQFSKAHFDLNKFMGEVSKISESFQFSPIADLINIGIVVRETVFYVRDENWGKAAAKSRELENIWNQSKPAMEQVGTLADLTKAHSLVIGMRNAVDAENKEAFLADWEKFCETLGKIRKFYYHK